MVCDGVTGPGPVCDGVTGVTGPGPVCDGVTGVTGPGPGDDDGALSGSSVPAADEDWLVPRRLP